MTKKEKIESKELNYFEELYSIDVSDKIEKKDKLAYLAWAWAWAEAKKRYPDMTYEIVKNEKGLPYVYDDDTGYMVESRVTINNITHAEMLPVMDSANKAMKNKPYTYEVLKKEWSNTYNKYIRVKNKNGDFVYEKKTVQAATMFDINTAIKRCLTKNIALHGLGLYLYAGEDIPQKVEEKLNDSEKLAKIADEELQETYNKQNEDNFIGLKATIESCASLEELKEVWTDKENTKIINSLKKYRNDLYEMIVECKELIKKELNDGK